MAGEPESQPEDNLRPTEAEAEATWTPSSTEPMPEAGEDNPEVRDRLNEQTR